MHHQSFTRSEMMSSGPFGGDCTDRSLDMHAQSTILKSLPAAYTVETPSEAGFESGEALCQHLPYPGSCTAEAGDNGLQQMSKMQKKLEQNLGPEYVSTRQGAGGQKLSYLEGWKAIDLANEIFGFNGWSSDTVSLVTEFIDVSEDGKRFTVGASATIRVTLRDGSFRTDYGFGDAKNMPTKAQAIEKAQKEAMTDGLKRAFRQFGRALGNCMYDNRYVNNLKNVKPQPPPPFDPSKLKRGPDDRMKAARAAAANVKDEGHKQRHCADKPAVGVPHAAPAHGVASGSAQGASATVTAEKAQVTPPSKAGCSYEKAVQDLDRRPMSRCDPAPGQQSLLLAQGQVTPETEADRARGERLRLAQARKAELARRSITDAGQADVRKGTASPSKEQQSVLASNTILSPTIGRPNGPPPRCADARPHHQSEMGTTNDFEDAFDLAELSASQINSLEACEQSLTSSFSAGDSESNGDVKPLWRKSAKANAPARPVSQGSSSDFLKRTREIPTREVGQESDAKKSRYGF